MDNIMDDIIAIWTITWTRKNIRLWSEEILFIFPENFTHPVTDFFLKKLCLRQNFVFFGRVRASFGRLLLYISSGCIRVVTI